MINFPIPLQEGYTVSKGWASCIHHGGMNYALYNHGVRVGTYCRRGDDTWWYNTYSDWTLAGKPYQIQVGKDLFS